MVHKDGKTDIGDVVIGIGHTINANFSSNIVVERDGSAGSENNMIVDEAMIKFSDNNFYASIGKIGVPFGAYETAMIADPLTKGIEGADKDSSNMIKIGTKLNDFSVGIYKYKDTDSNTGLTIGYEQGIDSVDLSAGFDYFNDGKKGYGKSNALHIGAALENGVHAYFEQVKTAKLNASDKASHIEVGYSHKVLGMDASVNFAYSKVDGGNKQKGINYSVFPADGVSILLESNDLDGSDRDTTFKVAYTF